MDSFCDNIPNSPDALSAGVLRQPLHDYVAVNRSLASGKSLCTTTYSDMIAVVSDIGMLHSKGAPCVETSDMPVHCLFDSAFEVGKLQSGISSSDTQLNVSVTDGSDCTDRADIALGDTKTGQVGASDLQYIVGVIHSDGEEGIYQMENNCNQSVRQESAAEGDWLSATALSTQPIAVVSGDSFTSHDNIRTMDDVSHSYEDGGVGMPGNSVYVNVFCYVCL